MQILCNGIFLDLIEGATIALSKSNPIFAFDDLTAERSMSFDIPATAKNNRVFMFAGEPHVIPSGTDYRYDAQLQSGGVAKDGWLHLVSYDPKKRVYKAVFVVGDMLVLKRAKDAGKLKSYLNLPWSIVYTNAPTYSTNAPYTISTYWRGERYDGELQYFPAINFASLFQAACNYFGITCTDVQTSAEFGYYLVPAKLVNQSEQEAVIGQTVRARDNMPDLTFIDLVKMWSALSGKLPYMQGNELIYFDFLGVDWEKIINVTEMIIDVTETSRKFSDYDRENIVRADDVEGVLITAEYTANNSSADGEKTLYSLPIKSAGEANKPILDTDRTNKPIAFFAGEFGIGKKIAYQTSVQEDIKVGTFLHRLSTRLVTGSSGYVIAQDDSKLPENLFLQSLLDSPVSITARVCMSMLEYEQIGARTIFLIDGVKYVWTKAEYNKNVVTLQLSRR